MSEQDINLKLVGISYQLTSLQRQVDAMEKQHSEMKEEIDGILDAANRWKGGFLVIVALGSVIGWLISVGSNFLRIAK